MNKVLIVDDNKDNRIVLSRMLSYGGFSAISASNGFEALTTAKEEKPDLVLMDLAMPEMDGWTATAKMKEEEDLEDIPIIVVTGHVTGDEILRARQAGCRDLVSKPIDYHVLIDKLRHHLSPVEEKSSQESSSQELR